MKQINEFLDFLDEKKMELKTIDIDWGIHSNLILRIGKHFTPDFKIDENNQEVLKQMLLYFTGNKKFNGDLNKGILLVGGVGTGKSLLFDIFKKYTSEVIHTNSFQVHSAIDIIDRVNVSGIDILSFYSNNFEGRQAHPVRCYIDDIGTKHETVKHYGTEINVIEQLLSLRYNIYKRYGTLTHASTNLFPSILSETYDKRITDRMVEMFNVIELKGNSRRN